MFRAISNHSVMLHTGRAYLASRRMSARGRASTAKRGIFGIGETRQVEWDMFRAISNNSVMLHTGRAYFALRRISAMGQASKANRGIFRIGATSHVEWDMFRAISNNSVMLHTGRACCVCVFTLCCRVATQCVLRY